MKPPFEGDTFIPQEILKLKRDYDIEYVIETGTQYGYTTRWFAENFKEVTTIEADKNYYVESRKHLTEFNNVTSVLGKSETSMPEICKGLDKNTLFFLDAHGCNIGGTALLSELKTISEHKKDSVIVIHDFKTDNPNAGYDTYDGVDLDMDFIKDVIDDCYTHSFKYHFNKEFNGANRGVIYIYP